MLSLTDWLAGMIDERDEQMGKQTTNPAFIKIPASDISGCDYVIFRLLPCHELQEPHGQVMVVCETTDIDIAVRGPAPKEIENMSRICIT